MTEKFKVDLDELDDVVRQLKRLRREMDEPSQKVKFSTHIPESAFGGDFIERGKLAGAHDRMQGYMTEVITALQEVIHDFGDKTEASRGSYEDQEHDTAASMNG
ncbi:hypothetical protein [Streptomyces sp. NPDC002067]